MLTAEINDREKRRDQKRLRQYQGKLRETERAPLAIPSLYTWSLNAGNIGRLACGISGTNDNEYDRFEVMQVIDADTMLVKTRKRYPMRNEINFAARQGERLIWVSGFSTEGVIDDSFIRLQGLFEVAGTKQYTTALGGSKTVPQIKPFPIQNEEAFLAKLKAVRQKTEDAAKPAAPSFRIWTDTTGTFTVEAKYGGVIGGKVNLIKKDGTKMQVPLDRLSKDDQDFIRK